MTGARFGRKENRRGFTLLEMVIVLGLFSVALTVAADIFMMANRTQRKTLNLERIQSDARYTMEAMTREIRSGAIDYPWYQANSGIPDSGYVETLALVDSEGWKIRFFRSSASSDCVDSDSESCLLVSLNDGPAEVVTPRGVNVFRSAFYIRPALDPYHFNTLTGLYDADTQPRVTISLAVESTSKDIRDRALLFLQTTVGTRNFRR